MSNGDLPTGRVVHYPEAVLRLGHFQKLFVNPASQLAAMVRKVRN
jgi:hypothetical protein